MPCLWTNPPLLSRRLSHGLGWCLGLPVCFRHIYTVILFDSFSASFFIAGAIQTCIVLVVTGLNKFRVYSPRPSPNSLMVSFTGLLKRFRISSFVGHLPSSSW